MSTYNIDKASGILGESTYINNNVQNAYLAILKNVYLWMTLALGISGLTAIGVANSHQLLELLYSNSIVLFIIFLAQLGLVWFISAKINSISINTATALFIAYSILTGVTLASIFIVFTQESIANVFFISAGTFAGISIYGYTTKRDLSNWSAYLIMALFGLIIASVVNWFMHSEILYWIISYVGVLVFVGLTAYDTQKIKQLALISHDHNGDVPQKVALIGALTLYLDFINLFIYLLRIFGKRK
jgi:FtsH-binding integral membrane protein